MSLGSKYVFLPWFRRGISTRIEENRETKGQRAKVFFDLSVISYKDEQKKESISLKGTPIELYGPGDIIGFDSKIVIRTDPKNKIGDFEPNYIPSIEFSEPDFPWRYTPTTAMSDIHESKTRLQPWICLIVLKSEKELAEYKIGEYDPKKQPAPFIIIQKNERGVLPLPLLEEIWAWSHVQLTTPIYQDTINKEYIQTLLDHTPGRIFSRILCPRKLEAGISYHAFIVPTFKTGVLAGLGYYRQISTTNILEPAWKFNQDLVVLPYYYSWEFRTGKRGDFEYLVRLLEPQLLDKRVGTRLLNCSNAGFQLPPIHVDNPIEGDDPYMLRLEGALMALDVNSTPWGNVPDEFQVKLVNLLNLPQYYEKGLVKSDHPVIVPPIYGQWHAARKLLVLDFPNPKWLYTLNLDPRYRTIAGLGTSIVQEQQERLMESAWKQIGEINEVNQILRQAQLACAGSERIFDKNFTNLNINDKIDKTSPLHTHLTIKTEIPSDNPGNNPGSNPGNNPGNPSKKVIKNSSRQVSIKYLISRSPIPLSVLDSQFKRIQRSRGPIRKRQRHDIDPNRKGLLERLNRGEIAPTYTTITSGVLGIEEISDTERPTWAEGKKWNILKHLPKILNFFTIIFFILSIFIIIILMGFLKQTISPLFYILSFLWLPFLFIAPLLKLLINYGYALDSLKEENIVSKYIASSSIPSDFRITEPSSLKLDDNNTKTDLKDDKNKLNAISRNSTTNNPGNNNPGNNNPGNNSSSNRGLRKLNINQINTQNNGGENNPINSSIGDIEIGEKFREYASTLSKEFLDIESEEIDEEELDLSSIENVLLDALDPNKTILEKVKTVIKFDEQDFQLEPIMAAPYFSESMYKYLRDMSQELLFPGLEYVNQNSISLLKPNRRFIEAYMVGLNHEMARELIWREYPTDQRGTYFQRFWDYSEFVPPPTNREELKIKAEKNLLKEWGENWETLSEQTQQLLVEKETNSLTQSYLTDINKIHRWYQTDLGDNSNNQLNPSNASEEKLVLLIRGELLKKYPRTVIYSVKGQWKENGERGSPQFNKPEMTKTSIFKGSLNPDVTFIGFDLTITEAKGKELKENDEDNPGWYFIIEERISETRFGIDIGVEGEESPPLKSWNDLSWNHIREKGLIRPSNYLSLFNREVHQNEPLNPDLKLENSIDQKESIMPLWGLNSAHIARIIGQKPFRVAIHADDMIPK